MASHIDPVTAFCFVVSAVSNNLEAADATVTSLLAEHASAGAAGIGDAALRHTAAVQHSAITTAATNIASSSTAVSVFRSRLASVRTVSSVGSASCALPLPRPVPPVSVGAAAAAAAAAPLYFPSIDRAFALLARRLQRPFSAYQPTATGATNATTTADTTHTTHAPKTEQHNQLAPRIGASSSNNSHVSSMAEDKKVLGEGDCLAEEGVGQVLVEVQASSVAERRPLHHSQSPHTQPHHDALSSMGRVADEWDSRMKVGRSCYIDRRSPASQPASHPTSQLSNIHITLTVCLCCLC